MGNFFVSRYKTKEDIQNLIQLIQTGQLTNQANQLTDLDENIFTELKKTTTHPHPANKV